MCFEDKHGLFAFSAGNNIKRLGYVAEQLLGGSLSALEVCNQAGFGDTRHLYNLSKNHYGCPAGQLMLRPPPPDARCD